MDVMHQRAREEDWMPAGRPPSGRRRSLGNRRCILRGEGLCRSEHDMDTRRALARTEEAALKDLVAMFKVESEEQLPVSFDVHRLLELEEGERRSFVKNMLQAYSSCTDATPMSIDSFIDKYLEQTRILDALLATGICFT
ncbi:unnamed protein product [Ectocarpus sp. CCAP 1310/34]|nr:unnamed protein product [Ectocarpus sp. CCAP 1310/34]